MHQLWLIRAYETRVPIIPWSLQSHFDVNRRRLLLLLLILSGRRKKSGGMIFFSIWHFKLYFRPISARLISLPYHSIPNVPFLVWFVKSTKNVVVFLGYSRKLGGTRCWSALGVITVRSPPQNLGRIVLKQQSSRHYQSVLDGTYSPHIRSHTGLQLEVPIWKHSHSPRYHHTYVIWWYKWHT